jgi:hypothetical protein
MPALLDFYVERQQERREGLAMNVKVERSRDTTIQASFKDEVERFDTQELVPTDRARGNMMEECGYALYRYLRA